MDDPPINAPRPRQRRLWVGLAATFVAGLALYGLTRPPPYATLDVEVSREGVPVSRATILLDGEQVCDRAPCTFTAPPGTRRVEAVVDDAKAGEIRHYARGGSYRFVIHLPRPR